MKVSRRVFLKLSGATAACACASAMGLAGCSGAARACEIPLAPQGSLRREGGLVLLSLSAAEALGPVGGAVRCAPGGEDAEIVLVVVHAAPGTYRAFADRCTHNGKALDYLAESQALQCRSRQARFDLDGQVLRGPAKRALLAYPTRLEGDDLAIEVG
jgi:nitrite reductase/ring-hydroxylating ferredoxin subunit